MNARHIGDFTSLLYSTLLLPPLCFCINCPLERVALDLSDTPPPHPHPSSLCGVGAGQPIPLTLIPPPPKHWQAVS
jgi:hypothetical protein